MDFSQYITYEFHKRSAFNISTGFDGRSYPSHWHSYGEIILIGPGEKNQVMINQRQYTLSEGDLVLIWPTEIHAIVDANRKDLLVIQFSNAFFSSLFDLQRIMHFYHDLHVLCVNSHPQAVHALQDIIMQMKEVFFSDAKNRELQCCMLLMQFMKVLDEYRDEFAEDIGATGQDKYSDDVMHRLTIVTDYIKNNLTAEDLSQTAMARMAGISRDYFSRIFKNVTGLNYNKWLNMIRLEKALSLLSEDNLSLTEVALLSGFQSIPSFNRVFRESKGMSPSEYRNLFSKN